MSVELDFSRPDLVEDYGRAKGSGVLVFQEMGKGMFIGFKFGYEFKEVLKGLGAEWNGSKGVWCFPLSFSGESIEEKQASIKVDARTKFNQVVEAVKSSLFPEDKTYKVPAKSPFEF